MKSEELAKQKVVIAEYEISPIKQEEASYLQYKLLLNSYIINAEVNFKKNVAKIAYFESKEAEKALSSILKGKIKNKIHEQKEDYNTLVKRRVKPENTNKNARTKVD